ncbi:NnrU family protein [Sphingomonas sp.]|uniref:NnrU family protein n=1 Tax=Sphingomonas sp. TaxID=28214 RepID=UPI00286AB9D2|nr:NnrU family protein [Sphingomonas sp.]
MNGTGCLALAAAAFVGLHFLLSHPFRRGLVAQFGERQFQSFYSVIALVTFGVMIWCYHALGRQPMLWSIGEAGWIAATILMWCASILLVGSFVGNPALPGARRVSAPSCVLAITRHPMMWSFAIWAVVHLALVATPKAMLFDGAILLLALGGAAGQDSKKRRLMGSRWHEWSAQTAYMPFGRGLKSPGTFAVVGGTLLFAAATRLHPLPVGIWRWIG